MRNLLLLMSLFSVAAGYSQEIELQGRYGASFIGGESIEFVGKDSFYFNGFYCTDGVFGKGRCAIRDGYLYLYFEKSKRNPVQDTLQAPVITRISPADATTFLQVTVLDKHNNPLPFTTVQVETVKKTRMGAAADTAGVARLHIRVNDFPVIITTSAVGIESQKLQLDSAFSYNITLYHRLHELSNKELHNGEVYVYEIDDLSEDLILMRPAKSTEPFRKYRKKKAI